MSNSRGTQIPNPRATIKLPHRLDWQREQMPQGYEVYHLALAQAYKPVLLVYKQFEGTKKLYENNEQVLTDWYIQINSK